MKGGYENMNPFTKINSFVQASTTSITTLVISIFILAIIVTGAMVAFGNEENVPRFKKALGWSIVGLMVVVLARVIVSWVRNGVA
jgi:hypothetical protein